MNRILTKPPKSVTIDGVDYEISNNIDNCLKSVLAIEDSELFQHEKIDLVMENMYGDNQPENIAEAIERALWFLSCGRNLDGKKHPKLIDWNIDAERLYSALLICGVNLDTTDIGWWALMGYIPELPQDSAIAHLAYLRQQYQKGKLSKDERIQCENIGWDVIKMQQSDIEDIPNKDTIWKILKGKL